MTRALAAVRAAPVFHSGMNSQFGSSFESSSAIWVGVRLIIACQHKTRRADC